MRSHFYLCLHPDSLLSNKREVGSNEKSILLLSEEALKKRRIRDIEWQNCLQILPPLAGGS